MIVPAAHTFKGLAKAFVSWCVPPGARGRISLFNSSGPSFPKEKRKSRPAYLGKGCQKVGPRGGHFEQKRAGYTTAYTTQGKATRITNCCARV